MAFSIKIKIKAMMLCILVRVDLILLLSGIFNKYIKIYKDKDIKILVRVDLILLLSGIFNKDFAPLQVEKWMLTSS